MQITRINSIVLANSVLPSFQKFAEAQQNLSFCKAFNNIVTSYIENVSEYEVTEIIEQYALN